MMSLSRPVSQLSLGARSLGSALFSTTKTYTPDVCVKQHAGRSASAATAPAVGPALHGHGCVLATSARVTSPSMHFGTTSAFGRKGSHPGRKYFADVRASFVVDEVAEVGPRLSVP